MDFVKKGYLMNLKICQEKWLFARPRNIIVHGFLRDEKFSEMKEELLI